MNLCKQYKEIHYIDDRWEVMCSFGMNIMQVGLDSMNSRPSSYKLISMIELVLGLYKLEGRVAS